jgi:hypothetical protein
VTTIAGLLKIRNSFCQCLLSEARVALIDTDWNCVDLCLHDFAFHNDLYTQAWKDILHPRFAILAPDRENVLALLRMEQAVITSHLEKALNSVAVQNASSCLYLVDRLAELLSHHRSSEQSVIEIASRTDDKKLAQQLASRLSPSRSNSGRLPTSDNPP